MKVYSNEKPIYLQLVDDIIGDLLTRRLAIGDQLPSVREFALKKRVNANTVQRVYRELESMGITQSRRGQGTFIELEEEVLHRLGERKKEELFQGFIEELKRFGFSSEDILDYLQKCDSK